MTHRPKVSVYIPTHNYAKYLDRAIESVLRQTMEDWELIVIDDGSTDDTPAVLAKYASHPKIRVVQQANRGLNVTNNIAIRLSNGGYVMRLDADDYLDENILTVLSSVLDRMPDVGLVYPDYYIVNETGDVVEMIRRKKIGEEDQVFDLPAHGACTMIRRECLIAVGGYTEEFSCQDGYDLWLKMVARFKPYNVNVPLFYYRRHGNNLTGQSQRILDARGGIQRRFVETHLDNRVPRTLGLVPAVGRSIYSQSDPFIELDGKPLIWYTLSEIVKCASLERIVVSSDDDRVLEYARRFDRVTPLKRSGSLTSATTRMEDVAIDALDQLDALDGYQPEAVCTLYINTPLRRSEHVDRAVDAMTIFKTDSVVSVVEELSHLYRHHQDGLTPVTPAEGQLRLEREALFRANGAIYLSRTEVIRAGRLLGTRVGHIIMLAEESIKTNSEFDLWLAERVLTEWKRGRA